MFHSVLVPIDGSVHSTCALVEAVDLAVATGARLTVMTCMPSPARSLFGRGYAFGVDTQDVRDAERDCRMLVNEAAGTVPADLPVTKVVACGRPADAIVQQARPPVTTSSSWARVDAATSGRSSSAASATTSCTRARPRC